MLQENLYISLYIHTFMHILNLKKKIFLHVPKCSSSHHLRAVIYLLATKLPSPVLSRVKLALFCWSPHSNAACLHLTSSLLLTKLLQNKAVVSVKKVSLTSVGFRISPISGNQPGNKQFEEQLHEFCHSCYSDILFFGEVGGWETFYLSEE